MKKFSLHIEHENHRSVFTPIVGVVLHQKLKLLRDQPKRRKVDWKLAINDISFLMKIQVRNIYRI
jgi:hypothetical protein